jgi:YD repeat-containing protein
VNEQIIARQFRPLAGAFLDSMSFTPKSEITPASLVISRVEPTDDRTTFGYDPADRQTSVEDPLGHVTQHDYDPAQLVGEP